MWQKLETQVQAKNEILGELITETLSSGFVAASLTCC